MKLLESFISDLCASVPRAPSARGGWSLCVNLCRLHMPTALTLLCASVVAADIAPIPRVLPPEGLEIPADVRTRLQTGLAATKKRLKTATEQFGRTPSATRDRADIDIFLKAVE